MKSMLALSLAQAAVTYAGAFHTIIGPDGRPMVVQRPNAPGGQQPKQDSRSAGAGDDAGAAVQSRAATIVVKAKEAPLQHLDSQQEAHVQDVVRTLQSQSPVQIVKEEFTKKNSRPEPQPAQQSKPADTPPVQELSNNLPAQPEQNTAVAAALKIPEPHTPLTQSVQVPDSKSASVQLPALESNVKLLPAGQNPVKASPETADPHAASQPPSAAAEKAPKPKQPAIVPDASRKEAATIDGETYITSEYLEDKEFNLEGKKRFYAMPEGVIDLKTGSTRMQMVEREKGVGKSVLDTLFKQNQTVQPKPAVLSPSYYRVSQQDAVSGLGQQCFSGKKLAKSKPLKAQDDVNLWPRAPLTEQFDYEVVKVQGPVQNIEIHSYASKENNPVFYWPFAVFLDTQGCVLEGAGGYKNNDAESTKLYREKIEGLLQVPAGTAYLLLTPLASAIDVDQRVLSNQGQLKLIAIR